MFDNVSRPVHIHFCGQYVCDVSKLYNLVLKAVNDCVLLTLKPQITTEIIGSTLLQATKALMESRSIALLYFRPLH